MVAALEHILLGGQPPHQFGPGYNRMYITETAGFDTPETALDRELDRDLDRDRGRRAPSES